MAMVVTNNVHYINISNAIRAAMGVSNQYKPAEMAAAINSIVDFYIQSVINNSAISTQAFERVTSGSLIQTNNQYYSDIANSIRAILGTGNLYKPSEMSTAISEIINILSSTSVIAVSAPSGSTVTCTNGNIDKTPLVKNGKWYFWGCGNGEWIISANLDDAEKSLIVNVNNQTLYEVVLSFTNVYGIKRDITSMSPTWERTNDAVNFSATASIGNTTGYSDFDNCYPWSEITRETLTTGDVMVKIPKFWFKRYREGNIEYIQIADDKKTGFTLHPAFYHNNIESECVYVGAYTTNTNKMSVANSTIKENISITDARKLAKSKGENWYILDISVLSAIQMLYLVEFATNDSQTAIGPGLTGWNYAKTTTGECDNIPNLTGRPSGSSDGVCVIYRGIENIWGNNTECLDGIYFNGDDYKYYICNNPEEYTDNASGNYTAISYTPPSGYISDYNIKSVGLDNSNAYIMLPTEIQETIECTQYYCDGFSLFPGTNIYAACRGGDYNDASRAGIFSIEMDVVARYMDNCTYRLLYIPKI